MMDVRDIDGSELGEIWTAFVNRMFRILEREPKNEFELKNTKEIATAPWWVDFLGSAEKAVVKFDNHNHEKTLWRMLKRLEQVSAEVYILNQIAPKEFKQIINDIGRRKAMHPKYHGVYSGSCNSI